MYEAQLVDSLYGQNDFCHVEPCNILGEDLILDEHCHQVTTRQELHEHVEESRVLERGVQLDEPRALCVGEDVAFSADVGKLIFFVLQNVSVKGKEGYQSNHDKRHTISVLTSDLRA